MYSINLLPENVDNKERKKKSESRALSYVSLFLIFATLIVTAGLYVSNNYTSKKLETLNSDIGAVENDLKREISNSKFLVADSNADEAKAALDKHTYFTNILELIRSNMAYGVVLNFFKSSIDPKEGLVSEFKASSSDYLTSVIQMNFWRKMQSVKEVSVINIGLDKKGKIVAQGKIKWEDDVILYKKPNAGFAGSSAKEVKFSSFTCGSSISDSEGNLYKSVSIGNQCWMKENLKVAKNSSGVSIKRYCYDDKVENCNESGGLYDWKTVMNGSSSDGAQGICPDGWHVPKDLEWHILENYLRDENQGCDGERRELGCETAGEKLKAGGSSGFDAPIVRVGSDTFGDTFFWSSSGEEGFAWIRSIDESHSAVNRQAIGIDSKLSVRCLLY